MNGKILGKPARFVDSRNEAQMLVPQRAPETPGHEQIVADFPTATRDEPVLFHEAGNAYRNCGWTRRATRLTTDNADAKARGGTAQAAINFLGPSGFGLSADN